jgi:hypothetical protein
MSSAIQRVIIFTSSSLRQAAAQVSHASAQSLHASIQDSYCWFCMISSYGRCRSELFQDRLVGENERRRMPARRRQPDDHPRGGRSIRDGIHPVKEGAECVQRSATRPPCGPANENGGVADACAIVQVMLIAAAMPCAGSDTINIHSRRERMQANLA